MWLSFCSNSHRLWTRVALFVKKHQTFYSNDWICPFKTTHGICSVTDPHLVMARWRHQNCKMSEVVTFTRGVGNVWVLHLAPFRRPLAPQRFNCVFPKCTFCCFWIQRRLKRTRITVLYKEILAQCVQAARGRRFPSETSGCSFRVWIRV